MATGIVYRCPNTGLNVQAWIADDPARAEAYSYQSVTCAACTSSFNQSANRKEIGKRRGLTTAVALLRAFWIRL